LSRLDSLSKGQYISGGRSGKGSVSPRRTLKWEILVNVKEVGK